jgi:hypothetical protein
MDAYDRCDSFTIMIQVVRDPFSSINMNKVSDLACSIAWSTEPGAGQMRPIESANAGVTDEDEEENISQRNLKKLTAAAGKLYLVGSKQCKLSHGSLWRARLTLGRQSRSCAKW